VTLVDIIIRVDKRKAYYMCFHDKESYSRFLEYSFRFRNFSIDSFIKKVTVTDSKLLLSFETDKPQNQCNLRNQR